MTPRAVAALAVLVVACVHCDSGQDNGRDAPGQGPRSLATLVEEQRGAPLADRVAVYLPTARSLSAAAKSKDETLHDLAAELVRARDYAVLEVLERDCSETYRKEAYWGAVSRSGPDAEGRRLLERWAAERPAAIPLARFRSGGIEFLLAKLEDNEADPRDRMNCAWELSWTGDVSLIPRMAKLVNDRTPVWMRSVRAGSGPPRLGDIVKRCIERLERIAKEREGK